MDERQTRIILFSEDPKRIHFIESFFNKQNAHLHSTLELCPLKISTEEIFLRYTPDLIFIDINSYSHESQDYLLNKLERVSEMIPLVVLLEAEQKSDVLSFVKRGVRDFVELPLNEAELQKIVLRFRRDIAKTPLKKIGRVYTFFSFKGGMGNTFLTINTAANVARMTKKRVLLWDMALQAGDIPFFLNFEHNYTLTDLIENVDQIDQAYLEGVLPAQPSGISILPAPNKIEEIERMAPGEMEKILNIFAQHFDYIFIDGGYRLTDALIPLLDSSSYLFITTTLELIALRSASRCLDILDRLNYPPEKIKIVVNRFNSKHEALTVEKAKKILRFNLVHFFENDYETACKSVNLGQTIMEVAPGSAIEKQFKEFADKIVNNFDESKVNKKLLQRFSDQLKKAITHGSQ